MDNPDLREPMIADAHELVSRLTVALTLDQDLPLHDLLRRRGGLPPRAPLVVRLPETQAWLTITVEGTTTVSRDLTPVAVDLEDMAAKDPALGKQLIAATQRSRAHETALQLVAPLFDFDATPTRTQIRSLLKWAPIIDRVAYRFAARTTSLLDRLRPTILGPPPPDPKTRGSRLLDYWNCALTGSHLSLIGATSEARPWLTDMAKTFAWVNWTPSFPLLRERTLWFAAVAARNAIAFGEPAVEPYLAALSLATHPMKVFDGVFGLVAIALNEPKLIPAITRELESRIAMLARQNLVHGAHSRAALITGVRTLRDPDAAFRQVQDVDLFGPGWRPQGPEGVLTTPGLLGDVTLVLAAQPAGLLALSALTRLKPEDYYPDEAPQHAPAAISADAIAVLLERAWAPGPAAAIHQSLH
jgi:hypothetical protein